MPLLDSGAREEAMGDSVGADVQEATLLTRDSAITYSRQMA
jgi:hypothetical protein